MVKERVLYFFDINDNGKSFQIKWWKMWKGKWSFWKDLENWHNQHDYLDIWGDSKWNFMVNGNYVKPLKWWKHIFKIILTFMNFGDNWKKFPSKIIKNVKLKMTILKGFRKVYITNMIVLI